MQPTRLLTALLMSGFMAFAASAQAELKIGAVSVMKILSQAPQAEAANQRLQREFAPREKRLADAQKSLQALEERLERDRPTLSDSRRRNLEQDILNKRRELMREGAEFSEDFNLKRNQELGKFQTEVVKTINELARREKYDLIVNESALLYANDKIDLTDKVLRALGR